MDKKSGSGSDIQIRDEQSGHHSHSSLLHLLQAGLVPLCPWGPSLCAKLQTRSHILLVQSHEDMPVDYDGYKNVKMVPTEGSLNQV